VQAKQLATFRSPQQRRARAKAAKRSQPGRQSLLLEAGRAFIDGFMVKLLTDGGKPIRTINRALRRKILYMLEIARRRSSGDRATAF
jgi:hypothetical protein